MSAGRRSPLRVRRWRVTFSAWAMAAGTAVSGALMMAVGCSPRRRAVTSSASMMPAAMAASSEAKRGRGAWARTEAGTTATPAAVHASAATHRRHPIGVMLGGGASGALGELGDAS